MWNMIGNGPEDTIGLEWEKLASSLKACRKFSESNWAVTEEARRGCAKGQQGEAR